METYIGDSVYVSFDGYQIVLRTTRGPPHDPLDHWIALEPTVWPRLKRYVTQLEQQRNRQSLEEPTHD
jgi:hypothetical protein